MKVEPAVWNDVLTALALEAAALGEGVAWDEDRLVEWWNAGVQTAVVIKEGADLVAYAGAMHLRQDAFEAIASGDLNPEHLGMRHTQANSGWYWLGLVIVDPRYQRQGAGKLVMREIANRLKGEFVADVYSSGGRATLEAVGWRKVLDLEHPIYTMSTL